MTTTLDQKLKLRRNVAAWSDQTQQAAAQVAESHQGLLPKRIGIAQLSGLNNIVQSSLSLDDVKEFVKHQAEKAERAERSDVKEYWNSIGQALTAIEEQAWVVANEAGLAVPPRASKPKELKAALNEVYLLLAQEWVQHFVAHSMMILPKREAF